MKQILPQDIKRLLIEKLGYRELKGQPEVLVKENESLAPVYFLVNGDPRFVELFDFFYSRGFRDGVQRGMYEAETMEDADVKDFLPKST